MFIYIFLSFIVFLLSSFLFNKYGCSIKFTKVNFITYIFWYCLIAQTFVSTFFVITKTDNHYIISSVCTDTARFYGWLSVQWCLIAIPFGMLLGCYITKVKNPKKLFERYTEHSFYYYSKSFEKCIFYTLVCLSVICIFATIYYCYYSGGVTIIRLISKPNLIFSSLRNDIKRNFQGIEYIKNIFSITLSPILCLIWYSYYKREKRNNYRLGFLCLLIFTIISLTNNLEKSPIFFFLLRFLFVYVLINNRLKKRTIILSISSVLIALSFLYIYVLGIPLNNLFKINSGILGRIILSQSAGLFCSFEYFPNKHNFLGFSSFPSWITNAMNLSHNERSARICMEFFNPKGIANNTAGVMNSVFIAEAWANWGVFGVLLSPIIVGLFIHILFFSIMKLPKHPIYVALLAYFSCALPITGGINDFLYPISIFLIVFIIYLIFLVARLFYHSRKIL